MLIFSRKRPPAPVHARRMPAWLRYTWLRYALYAVLGLVVLFVAGIGYAIATIDPEQLRGPIAAELQSATGRSVRIDGPLHLGFGDLSVEKVSLGNPPGSSRADMMTVGKIAFSLKLFPLLHKSIAVSSIELDDADILLQKDANGHANWQFDSAAPVQTLAPSPAVSSGGSFAISRLDSITIENAHLSMMQSGRTTLDIKLDKVLLSAEPGAPLTLKVAASYNGQDIAIDLNGGPFEMLLNSDRRWTFDGKFVGFGYIGHIAGDATHSGDDIKLTGLTLTLGGATLAGDLDLRYGGARPALRGQLTSQRLALADLSPSSSDGDNESKAEHGDSSGRARLFSDTPLPFDSLSAADADLTLAANEVDVGTLVLNDVNAAVKLVDGSLVLNLKAHNEASSEPFLLTVQASAPSHATPAVLIKAAASKIDLGSFLQQMGKSRMLEAKGDFSLEAVGHGDSLHAIAASANGSFKLLVGPGQINSDILALLGFDLQSFLNAGASKPQLICMVAGANIKNGQAATGLVADTTVFQLSGSGPIDLGAEPINMRLVPTAKSAGAASLLVPVAVRGDLTSPSVKPDMTALAGKAAGIVLGAIDPIGLAALAFGNDAAGGDSPNDAETCAAAIRNPEAAAEGGAVHDGSGGNPVRNLINKGGSFLKGIMGQ